MSGHSKWAKIKRAKGVTDQKRGAVFTKLGNQITITAREGGGDPTMNFSLRLVIDKAKAANMPKDNIQKAIDKGLGSGKDAVVFENISYEGYLGGDVAFIVDCLTDNKNRTFAEVKKTAESHGAILGAQNSVAWQFDEVGKITMYCAKVQKASKYGAADTLIKQDNPDEILLSLLDIAGVNDVQETELEFSSNDTLTGEENYAGFDIITSKSDLNIVFKAIEALGFKIESAEIVKIAKNPIDVDDSKSQKLENLIEAFEESDDVQNVWHNAK